MKLYEQYGDNGFHSSIVTSFGIDFDAYENVILSRLRGAGCHNNLLITDSNMLGLALEGASPLPRHAGKLYTVTGARARGVFHPKITLLLGRDKGRMIVSSANVTSSGLAGNLEVGGMLECGATDTGESRLVAACFEFLMRFLDGAGEPIRQQLDWMRARTPWLREFEPAIGPVTLADRSLAALLATGGGHGIGAQFLQILIGQHVKRLILVSPYWDDDLSALRYLQSNVRGAHTDVVIDRHQHLFPVETLVESDSIELRELKNDKDGRFVHAKTIIAQTGEADHVLFGSANCTLAALGNEDFSGSNEEVSLYRALPAGAAIEALGLSEVLSAPAIEPSELPVLPKVDELPLDDIALRSPGRFECQFDILTWWPPANFDSLTSEIELRSENGTPLQVKLNKLGERQGQSVRFRLGDMKERPALAVVRFAEGQVSAPAIVSLLDVLRSEIRDRRSKSIDRALPRSLVRRLAFQTCRHRH